jgi:hypothetical protein
LIALWPLCAQADFNIFLWDNDLFTPRKTDAYYTNGFVYHHVSDSLAADASRQWSACPGLGWITRMLAPVLPDQNDATLSQRHTWGVGQIVNTPWDLHAITPSPQDQPYSGLLYGSCGLQMQNSDSVVALDMEFGVVGPGALAKDTQDIAHTITSTTQPRGWGSQLRNEPIVNLVYEREKTRWQFPRSFSFLWASESHTLTFFDSTGFSLGPLLTSASVGINAMIAPSATPPVRMDYLGRYLLPASSQTRGFYSVAGVRVNAVLRNLFLDGNTWIDGPSVSRRPVVAEAQWLAGYSFSCLALQFGLDVSTKTFARQIVAWPRYGTFSVSWGCSL